MLAMTPRPSSRGFSPADTFGAEPLDPVQGFAWRQQQRQPAAAESPQAAMLRALVAKLFEKFSELPVAMIYREMERRAKAAEPMTPMDEAQLEHVKALTAATKAKTATLAAEDNPAVQLRKLAAARTIEAGDLRGAEDILEGRVDPGAAPAIVDTARESLAARLQAARKAAETRFETDPRQAAAAVRDYAGATQAAMEQARRSHPGGPGEKMARAAGEEFAQWAYGRTVPETPPPARSWWTGKPVQERTQPGQAEAEELRQTLVESILRAKEAAYGPGQAGVTPEEIGGHFDAKRRAWRTF